MHHPTDRIAHTTAFVTPVVEHWLEREIAQWLHPTKNRSDDPSHRERTLLPWSYISLLPSEWATHWTRVSLESDREMDLAVVNDESLERDLNVCLAVLGLEVQLAPLDSGGGPVRVQRDLLTRLHGEVASEVTLAWDVHVIWRTRRKTHGLHSVLCKITSSDLLNDKRLIRKKERIFLFNDALNTFYLWLYGVRHMVKDHSDSEKGNPLPPHRLLLSINSKGYFICTIPQTG